MRKKLFTQNCCENRIAFLPFCKVFPVLCNSKAHFSRANRHSAMFTFRKCCRAAKSLRFLSDTLVKIYDGSENPETVINFRLRLNPHNRGQSWTNNRTKFWFSRGCINISGHITLHRWTLFVVRYTNYVQFNHQLLSQSKKTITAKQYSNFSYQDNYLILLY